MGGSKIGKSFVTKSNVSFAQFKSGITRELGILETVVSLCYKLSFAKSAHSLELLKNEDWARLIGDARSYRNKPNTQPNGTQDAWTLELREIATVDDKPQGSKLSKKIAMSLHNQTPPAEVSSAALEKKMAINAKFQKLNAEYFCQAHRGTYCLIPDNGMAATFHKYDLKLEHLKMSETDRNKWATAIANGTATLTTPSRTVLDGICAHAAGALATRNLLREAAIHNIPPVQSPSKYAYTSQRQCDMSVPLSSRQASPVPVIPSTVPPTLHGTSSGDGESPLCSLAVQEWLRKLDNNPKRRRSTKLWIELNLIFTNEEIETVGDLLHQTIEILRTIGIKAGAAGNLLSYAQEDVRKSI
ncbi:SubName: Full=Uncharacterized protein {ECO:0000313/EMBL:CCA74759.1} [Serendipita indica DSM 11827]|uniref:Uncharacterized protein n=1 Tax=Serendipita indica (strain DSM 11827) TaxID=1109443 RepID=G4TTW6_SERID|nr:SubName: Full=Uncharacterized protein {ECO:0000313/EMBL:CCA74759.1} [Serendipita indica DSM 11827]CCA74759.1 hypothetical protein PIIN_08717 [Serendipita indica DSM 11827]